MSKFFEMLKEEIKSNPRLQQLAQAAKRDGFALITAPQRAVAGLTRAVGSGIEGVADLAGDVSEFIDRNAPRIEVGSGDSEIEIDPIGMQAKVGGAVAGLAEKAGEAISNFKSPAESALEAMDRKIAALGGSGSGGGVAGAAGASGAAGARAGAKAAGATPTKTSSPSAIPDVAPEPEVDAEAAEARGRMADEMEPVIARDQKRKKRAARKAARATESLGSGAEAAGRAAKSIGDMVSAVASPDVSDAAKAVPVDDAQAMDLFKTVHGGDFDPKSSMDKTKLAQIKENLTKDEYKGLSPNQFALRMYREAA